MEPIPASPGLSRKSQVANGALSRYHGVSDHFRWVLLLDPGIYTIQLLTDHQAPRSVPKVTPDVTRPTTTSTSSTAPNSPILLVISSPRSTPRALSTTCVAATSSSTACLSRASPSSTRVDGFRLCSSSVTPIHSPARSISRPCGRRRVLPVAR